MTTPAPAAAAAAAPAAAPAPAPILGFAFYLLGTGFVALSLAELGTFAGNLHAIEIAPLPAWAFVIGQGMVLLGLAVAWRATRGASRRLLGVAATLWLTLFVVEVQQGRFTAWLASTASSRILFAPTTASLVGRAIVILVIAVVVHSTARALPGTAASRSWTTTLGATLVFADAWAGAWPVVTRASFGHSATRLVYATPTMLGAGAGLLLAAAGLYATGRTILARAEDHASPASSAPPEPSEHSAFAVPRLTVEAMTAVAGLALAHALSVAISTHLHLSKLDVSDTATLGGEIAAWIALCVSLRSRSSRGFALAVLGSLVLETSLRYIVWSRGLLSPSSIASLAATLLPFVSGIRVLVTVRALRGAASAVHAHASAITRLRLAANLVSASLVASFFAPGISSPDIYFAVQAVAVLSGALALALMIAAASASRRIEIAPAP